MVTYGGDVTLRSRSTERVTLSTNGADGGAVAVEDVTGAHSAIWLVIAKVVSQMIGPLHRYSDVS